MAESGSPARGTLKEASDIVFDYTCHPCSGDNRILEAVGFCVDCSEFLCDECFRVHLRPTLTRTHKLLNMQDALKIDDAVRYQDACTDKCAKHAGKLTEHICPDHDTPGCSVCMVQDHKNCQPVKYIQDVAEDGIKSAEFTEVMRELEATLLRTRWLIKKSTDLKLHKDCLSVLDDLQRMKQDILDVFETMEKEIRTGIDTIILRDSQKMDDNIQSFESIQTKAGLLLNDLTRMRDNGQYCKAYVTMKTEKPGIRSLSEDLDRLANDTVVSKYKFQPNQQVEELLKHGGSFGGMYEHAQSVKSKATQIGKINIRTTGDDWACKITGMVSLHGDKLVAVDNNNTNVKLIDVRQASVVCKLDICRNVLDITAIDGADEMAVTTGTSNIQLLKVVDDTLVRHGQITTSSSCYAIAAVVDTLVISVKHPERLQTIDMQGNVLYEIANDEHEDPLFSRVSSIAVNQHQSTIYVADWDKNAVTCLFLSGKVKAVYKNKDAKFTTSATVDHRGCVYVGGDSDIVQQVSADCKKICTLLSKKDGIFNHHSLCYDTNTDRLFVGQYASDQILVYQLHVQAYSFLRKALGRIHVF